MNTEVEYTNTKQYINFVVKNFTNLFLLQRIISDCYGMLCLCKNEYDYTWLFLM